MLKIKTVKGTKDLLGNEIKLHEHESEFSIFYNEIITDREVFEITTGVDKVQSEQNHKDLEAAISGDYEESLIEIIDLQIVTSNNGKIKEFIDIFGIFNIIYYWDIK